MIKLRSLRNVLRRNLWRSREGYIYHQECRDAVIPKDLNVLQEINLRPLSFSEVVSTTDWAGQKRSVNEDST